MYVLLCNLVFDFLYFLKGKLESMVNKEQFKRLIVTVATLVIVCCMAFCFIFVWHNLYNTNFGEKIGEDYFFWQRGNVLLLVIYMLLYMAFTKSFNGFRVGYLKTAGLIGSQILGIISTNAVTYLLISLMGRSLVDPVPLLMLTAYQFLLAAIWVTGATYVYLKIYPPRKMIIVYGNTNARDLVTKMSERVDKYMICSSVSISEDLETIKEKILDFEAVIICDVPSNLRNQLLKFTYDKSIRTYITPKISDVILRGSEEIHLFDTPLLLSRNLGLSFEQRLLKRMLDFVLSLIAVVVLSPVMLLIAIAIKIDDGGKVIYKQKRLTINAEEFYVYKFRSMIADAEKGGIKLATDSDPRITRVGRFLRKCRLDEIPQFFNILRGDMSLVGPRPERPELTEKYEKEMPEFKFRLKVKAGLTGYAQVLGVYDTTPLDKLKMDLMYIERYSVALDLRIILMTLKTMIFPGESNEKIKIDK